MKIVYIYILRKLEEESDNRNHTKIKLTETVREKRETYPHDKGFSIRY